MMSEFSETLRAEILGLDDLPVAEVEVPEWGLTVKVRAMDAATWVQAVRMMNRVDDTESRAVAVAYGVIDDEGELVFQLEDIPLLAKKHARAIVRISDEIFRLNRGGDAEIEDAAENFTETQAGDEPSD